MASTALQILKSISEVIAANDDLGIVLSEIVGILADNLDTDVCSVYVYHEDSNELVLSATCGLNADSIGRIRLKPGEGITGAAFIKNNIINVASAAEHENFQYFKNSGEDKYKSFLSSPLVIGNKIVGVLNLQRIVEEEFSDEIVDMVKSLSTQIANLILSSKMLTVLSVDEHDTREIAKAGGPDQIMLKGISVNPGIAIGKATVYRPTDSFDEVMPDTALSIDNEIDLFETAVRMAKKETVDLEELAVSLISEADASIFDVHLMFLEDKSLIDSIKKIISRGYSVEYGIKSINTLYQNRFKKMKEEIFREKGADFKDVLLRLMKIARSLKNTETGIESQFDMEHEIIVARELLPSDLFRFTTGNCLGIVTEKGSTTSHVAILAKALNIPALLGVKNLMGKVKDSSDLILDCNSGLTYINPIDEIRQRYDEIIKAQLLPDESIELAQGTTKDGRQISMRANISLVSEMPLLKKYGAKGIGLYRTEFLYMIRDYLPSEDVQFNVFSTIVKQAEKEEVTFRLLDIGGDKPLSYLKFAEETNPALGQRGIRLLLERQDILRPHLRAILRAGVFGRIKIICPMVSSINEVILLKKVLEESKEYLRKRGFEFTEAYKIGIMLEIPSAFLQLEEMMAEVDCVSIGSNDLFQYTFALDRESSESSDAPDYMTPAFIKMIAKTAEIVNSFPGKELTICGEMGGDPLVAPLLVGAGIYDLSMQPTKIPRVKDFIRKFTFDQCRELLLRAVKAETPEAVLAMVKKYEV